MRSPMHCCGGTIGAPDERRGLFFLFFFLLAFVERIQSTLGVAVLAADVCQPRLAAHIDIVKGSRKSPLVEMTVALEKRTEFGAHMTLSIVINLNHQLSGRAALNITDVLPTGVWNVVPFHCMVLPQSFCNVFVCLLFLCALFEVVCSGKERVKIDVHLPLFFFFLLFLSEI